MKKHAATQSEAGPVVCTVAAPRGPAPRSVYMGAELSVRSSRPGAYDAMALPSLMNGRKHPPSGRAGDAVYIPREAAPAPLNVSPRRGDDSPKLAREFPTIKHKGGEYRPNPGSTPAKVIGYLKAVGGFISHGEISERFGVARTSITAAFKPALKRGVLVRQIVDGYTGFSLPGWQPPPAKKAPSNVVFMSGAVDAIRPEDPDRRFWPIDRHEVTPLTSDEAAEVCTFLSALAEGVGYRPGSERAPVDGALGEDDPEQMSALYELSLREAEHALLLRYIAVLQLRRQLFDTVRLFPLPPLTEPPRLADAA